MADNSKAAESHSSKQDTVYDLLRFLAFILILCFPFLSNKTEYQAGVQKEMYQTLDLMPANIRSPVLTMTHGGYQFLMFKTKFYGFLRSALLVDPNKQQDKFEETWSKFLIVSERIVDNTPLLIYQILFRLISSLSWFFILIPFTGACVYAGVQYWRLASHTGINVKIERYKIFRRIVSLSGWLFVGYLIIPSLGFSPVSHMIAPFIVIAVSVLINQMIKSYHTMI